MGIAASSRLHITKATLLIVVVLAPISSSAITLPDSGSTSTSGNAFTVNNTGTGNALNGIAASAAGVVGTNNSSTNPAIYGTNNGTGIGVWGASLGWTGVYGTSDDNGVTGLCATSNPSDSGVWGTNTGSGYGVTGTASNGPGVYGDGGSYGAYATGVNVGVYGTNRSTVTNVNCVTGCNGYSGVVGVGSSAGGSSIGVTGYGSGSGPGVWGEGTSISAGIFGYSKLGGYDAIEGWVDTLSGSGPAPLAGEFIGNVRIAGNLSKGGGTFEIDHPLDPANKYLRHSFVESPDMMNIYNGIIELDDNGKAWVALPDYFQAENSDYRYQLTCIGGFAPVYVAQEIDNNSFQIAGGAPGMRVSWTVTGIRKDAWANAHRVIPEVDKDESERGKYLYPAELGFPASSGIYYAGPGSTPNFPVPPAPSFSTMNTPMTTGEEQP